MAGGACRRAGARQVVAIEMPRACQALDLLQPLTTSPPLARVQRFIRAHVPPLDRHRPRRGDTAMITELIASGAIERASAMNVN